MKSVGVDVTRAVNNGVKAGSKAAVNVTSDGAATKVQKAITNPTKDNFKKKQIK